VLLLEVDLLARESQAGEPGGGVDLIAQPVACLLRGRAVVTEAVALDDQAALRPVEVDLEAVHDLLRERERQAGRHGERKEVALELGPGLPVSPPVQGLAEDGGVAAGSVDLSP
jgi:hypothetical protein